MNLTSSLPHLALTLGDPAGIGPEITLKVLLDPSVQSCCRLTIIGSRQVLEETYRVGRKANIPMMDPDAISLVDIPLPRKITTGKGDSMSGSASFKYLDYAIKATNSGNFNGIVTNPIAKVLWQMAGHDYPGQTEVLAQGAKRFGMLFVATSPDTGWTMRTLLATTHIPLSQVAHSLTPELLGLKLDLLIASLRDDFGLHSPQIAVAGLNPHSGEGGKLGPEEQQWLIPFLDEQRAKYPQVELLGPVPPDTLWVNPGQAWTNKKAEKGADAYLALYHDQGLIPVKMLAFDLAVNITIGLPFVRTSPDHGTAFDIAGKNIARIQSLREAILLAAQLCQVRETTLS